MKMTDTDLREFLLEGFTLRELVNGEFDASQIELETGECVDAAIEEAIATKCEGNQLAEYEIEEAYEEMLRDIYEDVDICGGKYSSARALKLVDPIMYKESMSNFVDNKVADGDWVEVGGDYYVCEG